MEACQKDLVLSMDCGTQSIRGFLFDAAGSLLCQESMSIGEYDAKEPGQAEIDPHRFRQAVISICQQIKNNQPGFFHRIAGITISCMRECMILVDEKGEAIRPCIVWLDRRQTDVLRPKSFLLRLATRLAGVYDMATKNALISYSNWLQDKEPENWKKAHKCLYLSSYLNHWLCGKFQDTASAQAGHVSFDSRHFKWSGHLDVKYYIFPLQRKKMVDIVEPGTVMGTITPEAAEQTGLAPGTKIIACGSDKACETLGCGCADDRYAVLSFGSQTTIQTTIKKYYEIEPLVPSFAAAVPGRWNSEQQIYRGFWMVKWFIQNLGLKSIEEEEHSEETTDQYILQTAPGSDGLMMYPYWGGSVKRPNATGAMIGFKDYHTRANIYRAMLEGIGYTLKETLCIMEKKKGASMEYLIASGGGSKSELVCQLMANLLDRPVVRMNVSEATGLGAAITGYVALGQFDQFETAAEAMTGVRDRFEPNPEEAKIYKKYYKKYMKKKKASW